LITKNAGGFRELNSNIQYALLQDGGSITRHAQNQLMDRLEISDGERAKSLCPNQCRLEKNGKEECGKGYSIPHQR
jgi:hypothetical protein